MEEKRSEDAVFSFGYNFTINVKLSSKNFVEMVVGLMIASLKISSILALENIS
jgi:hypothetical protein